jgi:hypothetical protein
MILWKSSKTIYRSANMNPDSKQKRIAFGYNRDINKIVLHAGQKAAVQLIYQHYVEGQSIADIAKFLGNASIPSPQNKPVWSKQTLANILSNPHYIGDAVYPKIIDENLFNSVQALKVKRAPAS